MATVDLAADLAKLKHVDNKTKNSVFGFIRQCQLLFDKNITYYNIPDLIYYTCLLYCRKEYVFMNGVNILSRDWNKWDEIEYDSDAASQRPKGRHCHKGKILTIKDTHAHGTTKIIIKCDDGGYVTFSLKEIKLKLIDNGTRIITYQEAHTEIYIPPSDFNTKQYKDYKYMMGENLLFREWKIGQEIEYNTDIDDDDDVENEASPHVHKGNIEGVQGHEIVIKQENGGFSTYDLNKIKIKFEHETWVDYH